MEEPELFTEARISAHGSGPLETETENPWV
jgi:hypothetical protein